MSIAVFFPLLAQALVLGPGAPSDDVQIAGPVPAECTVSLPQDRVAIDLHDRGSQSLGSISYTCNDPDGVVRTVSSENGGFLVQDDYRIAYEFEERGDNPPGFQSRQLSAPLISQIGGGDLVLGVTQELRAVISVLPRELAAGEYSDKVTIEISPN